MRGEFQDNKNEKPRENILFQGVIQRKEIAAQLYLFINIYIIILGQTSKQIKIQPKRRSNTKQST
jgi:DNA integrity scanning protein DisA with diadenylate cyclase activity